ncbi:MAG TPA: nitrous oxide reductase accessory protein NosL [Blastocatellia bacterium]|nr:nitrous oxide reductase accessory protein NosL [Blastocatellia bacterium]
MRAKSTVSEPLTGIILSKTRRLVSGEVIVLACLSSLVLAACQSGPPKPVALAPEDMCSYCHMAISSKRYAAEFIDKDGQAFKFDDIGCMISYINSKKNRDSIAAAYVNDYNAGQWIAAEEARYVHSKSFDTPMNFGIVAFKESSGATAARDKYNGEMIAFDDLFSAVAKPIAVSGSRPSVSIFARIWR